MRLLNRTSPALHARPCVYFMSHVLEQPDGCWKWMGRLTLGSGYGNIYDVKAKRMVGAHRYSYELFVGPIPAGLSIDHLCRNRRCVNPLHLEPVTHRENTLRGTSIAAINAAKTHCPQGHEYTPDNVYLQGPNKTNRVCKACRREYNRRSTLRRLGLAS